MATLTAHKTARSSEIINPAAYKGKEVIFSAKVRHAMWQADNKIGKIGDFNNFWDD